MNCGMKKIKNDGFVSLLGLLLVVVIIGWLAYTAWKGSSSSVTTDKTMEKPMTEAGINTSNYQTLLDSTRSKINKLNQQQAQRDEERENLYK